jgi:hypothetical protein
VLLRELILPTLAVAALMVGLPIEADAEGDLSFSELASSDIRMIRREISDESIVWSALAIELQVIGVVPPEALANPPLDVEPDLGIERFRNLDSPLTGPELLELLQLTGFEGEGLRQAWAVAMKESTGDPLAHNTNSSTGDNSYGLFQVNMLGILGPYRLEKFDLPNNEALFDPVTNAQVAYHMSNEGTNFGHWGIGPDAYKGSTLGSYPRWYRDFHEETHTDE